MPYGLFRTSDFHISVATSVGAKRVPLAHSTLSNIRISGGSLSHKTTHVQARRGFRLLTLAFIYIVTIVSIKNIECADTQQ